MLGWMYVAAVVLGIALMVYLDRGGRGSARLTAPGQTSLRGQDDVVEPDRTRVGADVQG